MGNSPKTAFAKTILAKFDHIWTADHGLSTLLIFLVLQLFLVNPLTGIRFGKIVMAILFSLILVSGLMTVSRNRFLVPVVSILTLIGLSLHWTAHIHPDPALIFWDTIVTLVFFVLLTAVVILRVFGEGPITRHRIRGAIAVYLLLGTIWAFTYQLLDLSIPGAFEMLVASDRVRFEVLRSNLVYFSFVTLTTIGYGDITALHPLARSFVIFEGLLGQLYPAIILARLIATEIEYRKLR